MTTVVPLLIFVWTLHQLDALARLPSQIGLGLALGMALVGYVVFRRLMVQMSELIQAIGIAVERGARAAATSAPSAAAPAPLAAGPPEAPTASPAPAAPAPPWHERPAMPSAPTPQVPAAAVTATPVTAAPVAGLGAIQEVHDLGRAIATLWQAEAAAFLGRRVLISVMNVPRPIGGTLVEATDRELLLETEGAERIAVGYGRISAIDAEPAGEE